MSSPLEPPAFERLSDQADDNDHVYTAETVGAKAVEDFGSFELLLVTGGVPRSFELDRDQAGTLRDQLTDGLKSLASAGFPIT
jgi:hypothetical protein